MRRRARYRIEGQGIARTCLESQFRDVQWGSSLPRARAAGPGAGEPTRAAAKLTLRVDWQWPKTSTRLGRAWVWASK